MILQKNLGSSFRDPSGFLFLHDTFLYRQVNKQYKKQYDLLMQSGCYDALIEEQLLIPHEEVELRRGSFPDVYKVIKPELIPFISYPYEWSFTQLKQAALTTLKIQKKLLSYGMTLKDASAYNVQFRKGRPIFIDTLSFEKYCEGEPWVAYKQFCQHFLAPLALMAYKDIRLSQLFRIYIDGIPLDLASSLLPKRTYLNFSLMSHIHLHAKSQQYFAGKMTSGKTEKKVSKLAFAGLIDNLESCIKKLVWNPSGTEWADYYNNTNYSSNSINHKKDIIDNFLLKLKPKAVWDLGGNTGVFSRIASNRGIPTVSFDIDPAAVEISYLKCFHEKEDHILPLVLDLTNPSPNIGWANLERDSVISRGPVDMALALAVIHHLAISNNVPLGRIAQFFAKICNKLIIEFVPKADSQVQRLLATRRDIFPDYHENAFKEEFCKYFDIQEVIPVEGTARTLYLMKKR